MSSVLPPLSDVTQARVSYARLSSAYDRSESGLTNFSLSDVTTSLSQFQNTTSLSQFQNTTSRLSQYPDSSLFSPEKSREVGEQTNKPETPASAVTVRSGPAAAYIPDPRLDLKFEKNTEPTEACEGVFTSKPPVARPANHNNHNQLAPAQASDAREVALTSHLSKAGDSTFDQSVKFAHALHTQTLGDSTFRSNCAPLTSSTPEKDASALDINDLRVSTKSAQRPPASGSESDSVSRFVRDAGVSDYVTAAERAALIEQLLGEAQPPADVSCLSRDADVSDDDEFCALPVDTRPSIGQFGMATEDGDVVSGANLPGGGELTKLLLLAFFNFFLLLPLVSCRDDSRAHVVRPAREGAPSATRAQAVVCVHRFGRIQERRHRCSAHGLRRCQH